MIKSKLITKVQFSEYLIDMNEFKENQEYNQGYKMFAMDINKCRRNILLNYGYKFPVYSVLDNIENFNGNLTDGLYYIETNNVFPLRKNGWYSLPIVEFCLKEKKISKFDIKFEYKPSFSIDSDYFNTFIDYLMTVFDDKDLQKLSVNALIGMFGRRENSFIDSQICGKDDIAEMSSIYTTYQRPFVNEVSDDYCIITGKN